MINITFQCESLPKLRQDMLDFLNSVAPSGTTVAGPEQMGFDLEPKPEFKKKAAKKAPRSLKKSRTKRKRKTQKRLRPHLQKDMRRKKLLQKKESTKCCKK